MTILLKKITVALKFSDEEMETLASITALTIKPREKWAHPDFKPVYDRLKSSLLIDQQHICFYCQKKLLNVTNDDWHIDHIIPIDEDPRHLFTPTNLILACKWCNRDKNKKKVLLRQLKTEKYSNSSGNYRVIHPRIDDYSLHIDILGGMIYTALSSKGRETKLACNLERFQLKYLINLSSPDRDFVDGAMALMFSDNPKRLMDFIKALP